VNTLAQNGFKSNALGAFAWIGSTIVAPFRWCWSCLRHPILTLKNIPLRVHHVAAFIWGWTIGLVASRVSRAVNYTFDNFFPSLKIPAFVAAVGGVVTFGTHLFHRRYNDKSAQIKYLAITALTALVSHRLAHRYTQLAPSQLEVAEWSVLPASLILLYQLTGKRREINQ
jgi:hypothetical protein